MPVMPKLNIPRFMMFLALIGTYLSLGQGGAFADTESIYGSFGGGVSFSGTVTVNTSAGATPGTGEIITGADIMVTAPGGNSGTYGNLPYEIYAAEYYDSNTYLLQISRTNVLSTGPSTPPYLDLLFANGSPISEASLCTESGPVGCNGDISQWRPIYSPGGSGISDLVPEPATLLLTACGLAGIGLLLGIKHTATT